MSKSIFMRVDEVSEMLGVSETYAYKLIRQLNKKLEKTGCITYYTTNFDKMQQRIF